jgi:photosystem II stability/assembly factor-like uncharacterized protein
MKKIRPKSWPILMALTLILTSCGGKKDGATDVAQDPSSEQEETGSILASSYNLSTIAETEFTATAAEQIYKPVGVGGGGAMSGLSMSPYSSLWFVGTDMGTLFRSVDRGVTWLPISQTQTKFSSDLTSAVGVGFSSNPSVVFHAPAGVNPVRSTDAGRTWTAIPAAKFALATGEKIKYWKGHSYDSKYMFAGTNKALWMSSDTGVTWKKLSGAQGESKGTYIDYLKTGFVIYHATSAAIYKSTNSGSTFTTSFTPTGTGIRAFTAGRDTTQITFAFLDSNGTSACADVAKFANDFSATNMNLHYSHCGYVWTSHAEGRFTRTSKAGGDYLKMAENNSKVMYVAGSTSWIRQYGTKVWRSDDAGSTWALKLNQYDWDVIPFAPWPQSKIEYSAVALDVGWWDGGYESFAINERKPSSVGGTGYFFLHSSKNSGEFWNAPFTKFSDTGERSTKKKWASTGLEVTTVYNFKFHPQNPQVGYAGMADVGGMVTTDGGKTFRITKAEYNSNYDYAFDPSNDQLVWAASGAQHDFPADWYGNYTSGVEGGVYQSLDRGLTWTRLTPKTTAFNRQFISIAYDSLHDIIYAGSQGDGIAKSADRGVTWQYFNTGLPTSVKMIPQIEVDPANGDTYALLTGDAPNFTNQADTGVYYLAAGTSTWIKLRGVVQTPTGIASTQKLWYYPTAFAVDFSSGSDRSTIWLTDYENNGNWLATGVWKTTDRGATWVRSTQYTHPLSITLDQANPNSIYVNGIWEADGSWGAGGSYYTVNGGGAWKKNANIPYQANGRSATIDPNNRANIFYTYFGSSMLYGARPQ